MKRASSLIHDGDPIIEIGGAPGTQALLQQKAYPNCTIDTMDISTVGIDQLSKLYDNKKLKGRAILGDFLEPSPLENQYSAVTSFGLIEHFENPETAIQRHFDFCKDNGTVFITIPNYNVPLIRFLIKKFATETYNTHNLDMMNEDFLKKTIQNLGYQVIEIGSFGYPKLPHGSYNKDLCGYLYHRFCGLFNAIMLICCKIGLQRWTEHTLWKSNIYLLARKTQVDSASSE